VTYGLSTLSQKSTTVAVFSPFSATVALFCDSVDRALQRRISLAIESTKQSAGFGVSGYSNCLNLTLGNSDGHAVLIT